MTMAGTSTEKGFFPSLFDFSFTEFIALKFIKVIYAILATLIILATLLYMALLLGQGGAFIALGLFVVPLIGLVYLVMTRIGLEVIAVLFRIGQNTSALVALSSPPPSAQQPSV
jgi:asparagine N-glycosylation enzyme membrane subunit Stt3